MPESDYQIEAQTAGASAAATIYTDELAEPIEINAVSVTSTAATSNAIAPDVQIGGVSIFGVSLGTVFQGSTAQATTGGITTTNQTTFDFQPSGKPIEQNSVILIDSEAMTVTGIAGSPTQAPTGIGVQRLTVTRGTNGTTAATHLAGAAVSAVKPTIASGGTATPAGYQLPVPVPVPAGSVLTIIGVTGATNLAVALDVIRV